MKVTIKGPKHLCQKKVLFPQKISGRDYKKTILFKHKDRCMKKRMLADPGGGSEATKPDNRNEAKKRNFFKD